MLAYSIKRILSLIPVTLGVVIIISVMTHLVPGDPVDAILGDYATQEDKDALRSKLGLDQPIPQQISGYIGKLLQGDLGTSHIYSRPVADMITERLPATVELALSSLLVALLIAIPAGTISAMRKGTLTDLTAMSFAIAGVAMPNFWLGPLLVLLFSVELGWLPVSEKSDWSSYILPSLTMGTALAAALSRITRNSLLDTLGEDFVRTARAKGCSNKQTLVNHVFRNASLPLVTVVGLQFGVLLTGAVITEKIFDWPGVGSLLLEGIQTRDYPIIQGCVLIFSSSYLFVNFATDILYGLVDPRISLRK
ncbi:ABC transporter permease [Pseudobacteriovorax antillogorgiicola]|uniref:Peptide/nickel transport system permease protein n=1 Tax=Pseudobacteriovorax antillogorgiicola TaxID=1513793 RepID=A0A1Y6B729_9BACT|nr:ABC transporter permease [Pseudobacteriovorax antillogorgiicola]TCS59503.1 peptide/nickel transport system permease protein [Pseudobacteriovorax antillogorgiicola]SME87898.1 peptide/nickel transport system permease protein [Pseudobacteriovorax antillogorgiicola]